MLTSSLAASLALALGQLITWEAGARGESRLLSDAAGDLVIVPDLAAEYGSPRLLLQAKYDPEMTLREPRGRGTFSLMQRADASGTFKVARRTRLLFKQTFLDGQTDLSWVASPADTAPSTIVRTANGVLLDLFGESTAATLQQQIARRLFVTGSAGYSIFEGTSNDPLLSLPRTKTAQVGLGGTWLARRDAVALNVAGSRGWVSNGRLTKEGDVFASWRHAFNGASEIALLGEPMVPFGEPPGTRYELAAAGGVSVLGGDSTERHAAVPYASLTLRRDEPSWRIGAVGARATARYVPVLDAETGALTPRFEASGTVDVRVARWASVFASGGFGWTVDATPPVPKLGQGGAGIVFNPARGISISAAMRVAGIPQTEWAAVVTTTVTQRGRIY